MKKVVVKFSRPWKIYSPGDVAGFEPSVAESLIETKVAEAHEVAEKPKADQAKK